MKRGPKNKKKLSEYSLFDIIEDDKGAREKIKGLIKITPVTMGWRGLMAVPPKSVLADTLNVFERFSDIALELPFFTVLHMVSAMLLQKGVKIEVHGQLLNPDLWTIL